MKTERVYEVTVYDTEFNKDISLGYAVGNPGDIKAFFNDQRGHEIKLKEGVLRYITSDSLEEKETLDRERSGLQERLRQINRSLGDRHE